MFLIINLGLKSIRGIIFSEYGDQLYSKSYPVQTSLFYAKVEQDAVEWKKLLDLILLDIKNNTDLSTSINYISVTTSSSCILGVDELCQPLTKVLMVSDKRSALEVESIKSVPLFKNKENEGIQCATASLIPKALWFKNNMRETFNSVKYWVGAGEYLNCFFTGQFFTDTLNASKAFHNGKEYSKELIEKLGIKVESLPEVKKIGTAFSLRKELHSRYGFPQECKFILTTYDAICAVIGSNNGQQNNACDVSGTVTSVRLLKKTRSASKSGILLSQYIDLIDRNLIGSSNNLGGGIIEWHKQAFFKSKSSDVYFKMENAAQKSKVGANGIVFLPYLLGERSPFTAANASATFFGIKRNSTIKDFTRAVFESTAYVTRDLISLIEQGGQNKVDTITVSGGLARFDLINQIKADVSNKPVYVVDNFESTAIGAYILMAISIGIFDTIEEALKKVVKIRKIINPSEANHKVYDNYFLLYKELNESLTSLYDKHKDMMTLRIEHENETVKNL